MKQRHLGWAASISICGLALYTATLLPDIDWDEGARAQLDGYLGRASSMPGGHPVYFWLGFLWSRLPIADSAWWINFSSALYGSTALFLFVLIGFEILELLKDTASRAAAQQNTELRPFPRWAPSLSSEGSGVLSYGSVLLASISMALSSTYWFCSTHPRPVSLNGVVLMAAVGCSVRLIREPRNKTICLLCFILGLSIAVHWMTLLLGPIFLANIFALHRAHKFKFGKASLLAPAGFLALGSLPYFASLFRDLTRWRQPVLVLSLAMGIPLGGSHSGISDWVQGLKDFALFSIYDFFPWGLAVGILGVWQLLRQQSAFPLLGGCFIAAALFSLPAVADRPVCLHPAWMLFALFLIPGWHYLLRWNPRLFWPAVVVTLLIPPIVYQLTPHLLFTGSPLRSVTLSELSSPETDVRRRLNPIGTGDYSARIYGERLLGRLPPNARLLAYYRVDSSTYPILRFLQQAKRQRSDLVMDELRGYNGVVSLKHLFQLHPEIQTVYLAAKHPLYDVTDTAVEVPDGNGSGPMPDGIGSGPEFRLVQIRRKGEPELPTPLKDENSNWRGYMTLFEPALGLRAIWRDDLWFFRLRFSNPVLYPHETRVDHLQVEPGSVSFTYAGFDFAGKIFGNTMLGEWRVSSVPEFHGEWRLVRSDQ